MLISEALGGLTDLAVHFPGGSVLNVVYKPTSFTIAELETLMKTGEKNPRRLIDSILNVITKWDLQDGDRVDVPLDAEVLYKTVPASIFTTIIKAINEDQTPEGK